MFSIKMRASREEDNKSVHISGAERILEKNDLALCANQMVLRAFHHAKGDPSFINIKIEEVSSEDILHISALPVQSRSFMKPQEAREFAFSRLAELGIEREGLSSSLAEMGQMRGALLVDASSLTCLVDDSTRGVRVTCMDAANSGVFCPEKQHYREAIVLASKVASAPNILAELCISDDPDYVTGYIASKAFGYIRLTPVKRKGDPFGGRIFFYKGSWAQIPETIEYLEKRAVLVENIPELKEDVSDLDQDSSLQTTNISSVQDKWKKVKETLTVLERDSLIRNCHPFSGAPAVKAIDTKGQAYLQFASNDYLGLANHPLVRSSASFAAYEYGSGSTGSRLTTGTHVLHSMLEGELARLKAAESCLLFSSGYMANLGTIQALCDADDVILSDSLNHASIIDGCRLSKARVIVYRHNDMDDLEQKARAVQGKHGIIVSDAVFSMDGDVVDLPRLLSIANRYGFLSMIDEAHATGVLGKTGRGIVEHFECRETPDITIGTLSKALGSEGGFVCGKKILIDYLMNRARSFIFSTALSPAPLAAAYKALDIMLSEPAYVQNLQKNIRICTKTMGRFLKARSETAIFPLILGDERYAADVASSLRSMGVYVLAIRYPSCARGKARLRMTIRADHTKEDIAHAFACFLRALSPSD